MEIISPLLMMLLLIWGWSLSMEDHFKDQVFVDTTIPILASFKNQFPLNSKSSNFLQLCPPSSKLTHHQVGFYFKSPLQNPHHYQSNKFAKTNQLTHQKRGDLSLEL
jgi:hypothetical protein